MVGVGGKFLMFPVFNMFNAWIPASSTARALAALLWRRASLGAVSDHAAAVRPGLWLWSVDLAT